MTRMLVLVLALAAVLALLAGCASPIQTQPATPSDLSITPNAGVQVTEGAPASASLVVAAGGQPPYSFSSDTFANGAPPMGTIVDLNGQLTGTPAKAGEYDVGVCVQDMARTSKCTQVHVTVLPKAEPPAAQIPAAVSVDSAACTLVKQDPAGTQFPKRYYKVEASGTAAGPQGVEFLVRVTDDQNTGAYPLDGTCGQWHTDLQVGLCQRGDAASYGSDDPDNTAWSFSSSTSTCVPGHENMFCSSPPLKITVEATINPFDANPQTVTKVIYCK